MRTKSCSGFTLIETAITILIISIIGIILFSISNTDSRAIVKIKNILNQNTSLLSLQTSLQSSISKIVIPYWISEPDIKYTDFSISCPFYNGIENNTVSVVFEKEQFLITFTESSESRTITTPSIVTDVHIQLDANSDGILIGCSFYYTVNTIEYCTITRFSTIPLSKGQI